MCHVCCKRVRRLVVCDVELGLESVFGQFSEHIIERSYYQCINHNGDGFHKDVGSIIVVCNKETILLAGLPLRLCTVSLFACLQALQNRICCLQHLYHLEGWYWRLLVQFVGARRLGLGCPL